ncbi:MAG TPA: hypothetical protein VH417_07240 [Vicinamibacterales bacterium]
MKNLRIFAPLTNGEQLEFSGASTGLELIRGLIRDELTATPQALVIEAVDKDGRTVRIVIPYDDSDTARVIVSVES